MFSILSNKLTYSDLKTSVENARQTRPFEVVRTGSSSNRPITPGYKGTAILKDSYYFPNILFDTYIPLTSGDRILFYGQTNQIENGIWNVMSIITEEIQYVNIQRPADYAKNTPIRSGQYLLIAEGETLSGNIYKNTTPEYDSNQNKIIAYNGTSPQTWAFYTTLYIQVLKPINKVTFYSYPNFSTQIYSFGIGDYYDFYVPNGGSIKIPTGYKVRLFSGIYYSGVTISYTSDVNPIVPPLGSSWRSFRIESVLY